MVTLAAAGEARKRKKPYSPGRAVATAIPSYNKPGVGATPLPGAGGACPKPSSRRAKVRIVVCSLVGLLVLAPAFALAEDKGDKKVPGVLNFKMKGLDGKEVDLSQFQGKVVLIVNVASKCGNTPQYEGLQKLYDKYGKDGFVILGVPANEFGKQEPGTDAQIAEFCKANYGVTFPMLSKVVVKGEGICPLYKHLTSKDTDPKFAGEIEWNFAKFLIGKNGEIVNRFKPKEKPEAIVPAIEAELKK
jgi:glutathione peroxidase